MSLRRIVRFLMPLKQHSTVLLFWVLLGNFSLAQVEIPKTRTVENTPNTPKTTLPTLENNDKNNNYFTYKAPEKDEKAAFSMTDGEKFLNPGDYYIGKLNNTIKTNEGQVKTYYGNTFLGDYKTSSSNAAILCRDFGDVDGDRIAVYVNDEMVIPNLYLEGNFKALNLALKPGFNKIDFKALNQGTLGPNTAELRVYDDQKQPIAVHQWNLSTNAVASILIIKGD